MAKGKKSKSEGKKAKIAEKKQKQDKKNERKEKTKISKTNESDDENVDLDAVLAEYAKKQEQFLKVSEVACEPPRPRASSTLIASPSNSNELFLFGGEYFDGTVATFFNDLYIYLIDRDKWRLVTSPNTPLPRSGHAWCRGGNADGVYLFGGEFSSPKQGTFYHYNDFWRFNPSNREWARLESKGKWPPARSGHRMTYFKNYIILFGGFQDTAQQTKYLADLWIYDTQNFLWYSPVLPLVGQKPDPRSSFTFLPHESGAVLHGGYSRIKAMVAASKRTRGGDKSQRNVFKPMIHQDCFYLRFRQPAPDSLTNSPPMVHWERRKKPANVPNPPRAGATMAYHKGRGISFGGVHDVEESEEGIDSEFFNTLYAWNIDRNRYFPLSLRKPRTVKKQQAQERGGRRGRGQENVEELLRNLAALETGKSITDVDDMDLDKPEEGEVRTESNKATKLISMDFPHPRFNAQLAVQDDVLYIYGGTFERGNGEYTFDEMYAIDLGKLDGVKEIFHREPANWLESDDDDSGEGSSENSDEDEEDDDGDINIVDEEPVHQGYPKKSKIMGEGTIDESPEVIALPMSAISEEEAEVTEAVSATDSLPYPRPFESRRDFFNRTSNEWQEILMKKLRRMSIQPETLSVKEIKTKAFEMSEEKWWDCREEIAVLEDEQDLAGIGEVVTLAEKGEGVGVRRR
jgi:Domain of unknown function (DUF4110)/Galactose oxidase, central domain